MSVYEKLRTYPSPTPTTVNLKQGGFSIGLEGGVGEGEVNSSSDTDFHPNFRVEKGQHFKS